METCDVSGTFERGSARVMQRGFQLRFPPHQHRLHFLRGLEFKILPQIAVGTGNPDLLAVLRNLLVHQLFVFRFAFVEAAPGNNQRRALLFLLFAGDDAFQRRDKA